KVLTTRASTNAMSRSTGSSRSSEPFFGTPRRVRPEAAVAADSSCFPGSSPGTTSAGPPGRSLLIASRVRRGRPAATTAGHDRLSGVSARDDVALLLDLGGLAAELPEVV